MTLSIKKITKITAAALAVTTALLTPTVFLGENKVFAASEKTKYIKELRVFTGPHADKDDAEAWCKKQPENKDKDPDNDWAVFSDNLDKGADGALKKWVGVYLCYQTTTDPNKAIRDLAVMNEQGNYSEGAYERILKDQRDMYMDMVNDSKAMIEEYRTNYQNSVPTAVQAHDFMNSYVEDDSGKLFGDLMLDVSDDDLTEILLQANGQSVLMMQEQLAYACDTGKSTWLDRMSQIGSYETLRKQAYKACNNDANKADKLLKQKYYSTAQIIAENWNDIYHHFENVKNFAANNGLDKMSEEELEAFYSAQEQAANDGTIDNVTYVFMQEQSTLTNLAAYKYGDGTLFDFFNRDQSAFSGDNIKELYPLAASLSKGQYSALNETVSLYTLLMDAQSATVNNQYDKGMAAELDKADEDTKEETNEMLAQQQENLDKWKKVDPISIYEGIDRGVYDGGVAVTSTALKFGNSKGANWTDSFVENGGLLGTAIGLGAGSLLSVGGAVVFAKLARKCSSVMNAHAAINKAMYNFVRNGEPSFVSKLSQQTIETIQSYPYAAFEDYLYYVNQLNITDYEESFDLCMKLMNARDEMFKKTIDNPMLDSLRHENQLKIAGIYQKLEMGMAVLAIAFAAADITMTVIELYKYYNRDHLPIPKYMVDLSYNENKETSFISYRGVLDQDGDQGDLNGGSGKQWLALYASYDEDAGDPILAPSGNLHEGITQRGKNTTPDGYSPLHFFGKPNAPQNLTFADGDNGWSFNDKEGGTYFFFERDNNTNTNN